MAHAKQQTEEEEGEEDKEEEVNVWRVQRTDGGRRGRRR